MQFGRGGNLDGRDPITGRKIDPVTETPLTVMQREMQAGERLLWADRPINRSSFSRQNIGMALFGIPFLAFALFWTGMALSMTAAGGSDMPWFFRYIFPAFGIPFIVVGLGLVLSPFIARFRARRLTYGLTDRRLLIREDDYLRSFTFGDIQTIDRRDNRDGTGDVVFREEAARRRRGAYTEKIGFFGIAEPQKVEQAIVRARADARAENKGGSA